LAAFTKQNAAPRIFVTDIRRFFFLKQFIAGMAAPVFAI
jgi:hypothetical protein